MHTPARVWEVGWALQKIAPSIYLQAEDDYWLQTLITSCESKWGVKFPRSVISPLSYISNVRFVGGSSNFFFLSHPSPPHSSVEPWLRAHPLRLIIIILWFYLRFFFFFFFFWLVALSGVSSRRSLALTLGQFYDLASEDCCITYSSSWASLCLVSFFAAVRFNEATPLGVGQGVWRKEAFIY